MTVNTSMQLRNLVFEMPLYKSSISQGFWVHEILQTDFQVLGKSIATPIGIVHSLITDLA